MPSELSLLGRWSAGLAALLDAAPSCEKVAAALLAVVPSAVAAECDLDSATGKAGSARSEGVVVRADIELAGWRRGQLRVTVPTSAQKCEPVLSLAARLVALRLPTAPDSRRHLMELVTLGEAAGYLVHAINNHLNSMVLQAACVQMQTQSPLREQAENIRHEGARAAARLRPLQLVLPWPARPGERVDVVATIRQVLRDEPELARVEAHLPDEEILLSASAMGMKRLLTLLLRVARRCTGENNTLRLELARTKDVELSVQMPGVVCDREEEGLLLPPDEEGGLHQVERDAARWLVRQSGGHLDVTEGPDGAVLTARWEG
jgi:hypothetical protein